MADVSMSRNDTTATRSEDMQNLTVEGLEKPITPHGWTCCLQSLYWLAPHLPLKTVSAVVLKACSALFFLGQGDAQGREPKDTSNTCSEAVVWQLESHTLSHVQIWHLTLWSFWEDHTKQHCVLDFFSFSTGNLYPISSQIGSAAQTAFSNSCSVTLPLLPSTPFLSDKTPPW